MKNVIKMRVTLEQNEAVQKIVFKKGGRWYDNNQSKSYTDAKFLLISKSLGIRPKPILSSVVNEKEFLKMDVKEIPAEIFIQTDGTCT